MTQFGAAHHEAMEAIAEAIHQLGNAHATNKGDGGQGAIEVLSFEMSRIADALGEIAVTFATLVEHLQQED